MTTKEEALEIIKKAPLYDNTTWTYAKELHEAINILEQEPKTGHWIKISSTDMYCSECNEMEHLDTSRKFCAYCGTRMVEPQEREVNK